MLACALPLNLYSPPIPKVTLKLNYSLLEGRGFKLLYDLLSVIFYLFTYFEYLSFLGNAKVSLVNMWVTSGKYVRGHELKGWCIWEKMLLRKFVSTSSSVFLLQNLCLLTFPWVQRGMFCYHCRGSFNVVCAWGGNLITGRVF